jgi:hypothetical protein
MCSLASFYSKGKLEINYETKQTINPLLYNFTKAKIKNA